MLMNGVEHSCSSIYDDTCVYIFDESGAVIDDPGNFTPSGRQEMNGEHGFIDEWRS